MNKILVGPWRVSFANKSGMSRYVLGTRRCVASVWYEHSFAKLLCFIVNDRKTNSPPVHSLSIDDAMKYIDERLGLQCNCVLLTKEQAEKLAVLI